MCWSWASDLDSLLDQTNLKLWPSQRTYGTRYLDSTCLKKEAKFKIRLKTLLVLLLNYIDLDLKEFNLDRKKIRILNLTINFAILRPDKGNGIFLMKRSDCIAFIKSLFSDTNKFKKIVYDPTPTWLSSLQKYLST